MIVAVVSPDGNVKIHCRILGTSVKICRVSPKLFEIGKKVSGNVSITTSVHFAIDGKHKSAVKRVKCYQAVRRADEG